MRPTSDFTEFSADQTEFKTALVDWAVRTTVLLTSVWSALSLWGDAAPSTNHDSVYLVLFAFLSGAVRQRFWITIFSFIASMESNASTS